MCRFHLKAVHLREIKKSLTMKYNLEDKPKGLDSLLYGLQWFSVTIPSLIVLSGIVAGMYFDTPAMMTVYMQKCFFITGLALLIQILYGHRMPMVMGPASILIIGLVSTQSLSVNASFTAIAIGGAMVFLLSFSKIFHYIQKIFTSRVISVTMMLVAISMMPLIIDLSKGGAGYETFNICFVLIFAFVMVLGNHFLKGIWNSLIILLGLIVGSIVYISIMGLPESMNQGEYTWQLLFDNFFIHPEFDMSAIIAFLFCFIALLVNELGSIQAVASYLKADNVEDRSQKGVRVGGFFNTISGVLGLVGLINFSLTPGVIAATRVASRYPLLITGLLLIVCALIPQSLAIFSYIPSVIMGGIIFYTMSMQLGAGFQLIVREKTVAAFNTMITVSFPIIVCVLISFAPEQFKDAIPSLLHPILGNGFVMGIISVLLLDNLLCRNMKKEKE